jgi:hypothetical protein
MTAKYASMYRGFELMECVCIAPQERAGDYMVSIYDGDVGILHDAPSILDAKMWIDRECFIADAMLWNVVAKARGLNHGRNV